jgi:hypothetical protein
LAFVLGSTERYSATEFVCNYIIFNQLQFQAGRLKPSCQRKAWDFAMCGDNDELKWYKKYNSDKLSRYKEIKDSN